MYPPIASHPLTPNPLTNADRPRLRGPAFAPDERCRTGELAHFDHWQDLVDRRLIGTTQPLSPDLLAGIDAAERALGVGKYRSR